jgi:hypothetical protein
VTILAGIVDVATFHLDGNDVEGRIVVSATSLGVEIDSIYPRMRGQHGLRIDDESHWTIGRLSFPQSAFSERPATML